MPILDLIRPIAVQKAVIDKTQIITDEYKYTQMIADEFICDHLLFNL